MRISVSTREYLLLLSLLNAARTPSAVSTRKPIFIRVISIKSRMSASSSTTNTGRFRLLVLIWGLSVG